MGEDDERFHLADSRDIVLPEGNLQLALTRLEVDHPDDAFCPQALHLYHYFVNGAEGRWLAHTRLLQPVLVDLAPIEKAGDFNIGAFDFANGWLVYSDCTGTSVLHFEAKQLSVQSYTQELLANLRGKSKKKAL